MWMMLSFNLAHAEAGFGGQAGAESTCLVEVDGAFVSCDELMTKPARAREFPEGAPGGSELPPPSPPTPTPAAAGPPADTVVPEAPPPLPKSALRLEIERAKLSPETPLIAARLRVADTEVEATYLEEHGYPQHRIEAVRERLAREQAIKADLEEMALNRMLRCSQLRGTPINLKRYQMTAAGPIPLTFDQMMSQLPPVDPAGCDRLSMIDDKTVNDVLRAYEVFDVLKSRRLGYFQSKERADLYDEQKRFEQWFTREGLTPLTRRRFR